MSNLQIGRNTDGKLTVTITDLTDTELHELIRVATTTDTATVSPAKWKRPKPPIMRYAATK